MKDQESRTPASAGEVKQYRPFNPTDNWAVATPHPDQMRAVAVAREKAMEYGTPWTAFEREGTWYDQQEPSAPTNVFRWVYWPEWESEVVGVVSKTAMAGQRSDGRGLIHGGGRDGEGPYVTWEASQ